MNAMTAALALALAMGMGSVADFYGQMQAEPYEPIYDEVCQETDWEPTWEETTPQEPPQEPGEASEGGWRYTEYYPSENTGAFAYAPDLEITLGEDGTYRDPEGYVVVAGNRYEHEAFDVVETPYGLGTVYDTGCSSGIIDVYREG